MYEPLAERIIKVFAPHSCLLCEAEGMVVCSECQPQLARSHRVVCYKCNALSEDFKTCSSCRSATPLKRVWVAARYEAYVKELIRLHKFERNRAAHLPLARLIQDIVTVHNYDVIVPVPSVSSRYRLRGYNPAQLIANELSRYWEVPSKRLLGRKGQARQVGKSRKERIAQLEGSIYPLHETHIKDARILLIDDVMTTGTTLVTCASVLKAAGAKRIEAAVIAR